MKTITPALLAHLAQEVTTLCTCWRIVRTDGKVFGFTDHDTDLEINDVTYESESGYNRTAIASDTNWSVDNLDVAGFLESDKISEEDLRNGLFDFASVYIFAVNWMNPTMGDIKLRRGWFGEVTTKSNGQFETEIRGLLQALLHDYIESFTPECRADFCDDRCKLIIADFSSTGTVISTTSRSQFIASSIPITETSPTTSEGSHKYWRIQIVNGPTVPFRVGFGKLRFYDQDNTELTGGEASASSHKDDHTADKARDNKTDWLSADDEAEDAWWQVEFGSDKDIKAVSMVPADNYNNTPTAFILQWSDDGVTFHDAKACSVVWTAYDQFAMWEIGSDTTDPVYFSTDLIDVPPPLTGATTYTGGTITFTSGPNSGRAMEIVDFDPSTNEVTLFEEFPYIINIGDLFTISQGCDKSLATCKLYNNVKNYRGEPHVPGEDSLMTYPDAHD